MSTPTSIADFLNRLGPVAVAKLDAYPIKTNVQRSVTGDMVNSAFQDFANLVANLLSQKQGVLTFDNTPAAGSSNPVTSAGIAAAITNQIAAALVGYMTQPQVAAAITDALAPYSTTAQTAQQIASAIATALADYSTTAQMQTAITDALNEALAAYDTHAEVVQEIADAIAAALTDYVTGEQMTTAIAAALTDYVTTAAMNTALAGKQDKLTAMGSTTKPVYVYADGTLAPCDDYAGGTKVVLNGEDKGGKSISIYAPTGKGNAEQYYGSKAPDAPGWVTPDNAPTEGSGKLVKSGGIFTAIANAVTGAINTVKTWAEGIFAKIDGYYQTLTAGAAENLVGRGTTPAVISFRPAGGTQDIGTGAASIAKIKGRTDAWNQLIAPLVNTTITVNGVTFTYDANGKCTIAGTATGGGGRTTTLIGNTFSLINGHKYFVISPFASSQLLMLSSGPNYIFEITVPNTGTILNWNRATGTNLYFGINTISGTTYSGSGYFCLIDLTLQYGAGREPATAAAFLAEYPEALFAPYNAGKLVNNKVTALVTTGYNLYNPANGEAHLVANQKIQICGTYTGATIDGEAVVFDANGYFTPTRDCVMVVEGGNATDTDVHFSHSGIRDYGTANYQYEPYWKSTLNIDHSKIYGKLEGEGEMVQIAPNGFRGVGDNYDEVDVVRKEAYIRRAWVDLGTLNWSYVSGQGFFQTGAGAITPAIAPTATQSVANILTTKYLAASSYNVYNGVVDKAIAVSNDPVLRVRDTAYSDAAAFKAAMDGVMLDYQLATPLHYTDLMYSEDGGQTFTEIPSNYRVDDFGTEQRLPSGIVDGAPASTPLVADIAYAMNAVDTLRRLPTNYLSKQSTENLLAALQTAGVIAGYTMTYDDTNEQYDFTITPNA